MEKSRKVAILVFLIASDCKLCWPMLACMAQLGLKAIVLGKNLRRPENPAARASSFPVHGRSTQPGKQHLHETMVSQM